jgi:hypothetical protein
MTCSRSSCRNRRSWYWESDPRVYFQATSKSCIFDQGAFLLQAFPKPFYFWELRFAIELVNPRPGTE